MYHRPALCMALLSLSGAAVADEPVAADKAPQKATQKQADSGTTQSANGGTDAAAQAKQQSPQQDAGGTDPAQKGGDVKMSGMSILGNEETPKSLVIVPWKSSQLGDMPGVARLLDSTTQPVDKDVFMRELSYYEIKSKAQ